MAEPSKLLVEIDVPGAGEEELETLSTRLRGELLELDVAAVDRARSESVPDGARGLELAALGTLLVTAGQGWDVLANVVNTVRSWASRETGRTVKLTLDGDAIELTGASSEDQRRLLEAFIERHRGS